MNSISTALETDRIIRHSILIEQKTLPSVLIGKSVTFWPSFKEAAKWGRAELLRSNSTML
jgi:hypothetical protein